MKKAMDIISNIISIIILVFGIIFFNTVIFNLRTIEEISKYSLITIVLVFITFILSIYIHEIGHAIVGLLYGFSLEEMNILFLNIRKKKNGFKFKVVKKLKQGLAGSVIMTLKNTEKIERKLIALYLGGSLFNIIAALLLIIVSVINGFSNGIMFEFVFFLIFFSLFLGLSSLLTMSKLPPYSDGFWVYHLLKGSYYKDLLIFEHSLLAGEKISDLEFMNKNAKDNQFIDIYLDLFKYYKHIDKEEIQKALKVIEGIHGVLNIEKEDIRLEIQKTIDIEKLYLYSALQKDEQATIIYNEYKDKEIEEAVLERRLARAFAMYEFLKTKDINNARNIYKEKYKEKEDIESKVYKEFERKIAKEKFEIEI